MRTKHVKWDTMWETYFENYSGYFKKPAMPESESSQKTIDHTKETESQAYYYFDLDSDSTFSCNISEPKSIKRGMECNVGIVSDDYYDIHSDSFSDKHQQWHETHFPACNIDTKKSAPVSEPSHTFDTVQEKVILEDSNAESFIETSKTEAEIPRKFEAAEEKAVNKESHTKSTQDMDNKSCNFNSATHPGNIILECGPGMGTAISSFDELPFTHRSNSVYIPKTLGTVAIDTSCLTRPKTRILFNCNITFTPTGDNAAVLLEFVLSKDCNHSLESPIGNWVYNTKHSIGSVSQSFRLSYCNSNAFPGCYNYYVRVIPIQLHKCCVSITNCYINAVAQSS